MRAAAASSKIAAAASFTPVCVCARVRGVAGAKKRGIDDTLSMMKQQLSASEWRTIHKETESQKREDVFRKFWSLKEAYTKGRGDGLGFEFNRCDFKLAEKLIAGTSGQPVQRATLDVDGKPTPSWGFYIQVHTYTQSSSSSGSSDTPHTSTPRLTPLSHTPLVEPRLQALEADHWISAARGPPTDVIDAHGVFLKTFVDPKVPTGVVGEQLALAEPPFVYKTLGDLIDDEMKAEYAKVKGLEPDEVLAKVRANM